MIVAVRRPSAGFRGNQVEACVVGRSRSSCVDERVAVARVKDLEAAALRQFTPIRPRNARNPVDRVLSMAVFQLRERPSSL